MFVMQIPGSACQIVQGCKLALEQRQTQTCPSCHSRGVLFCSWITGNQEIYLLAGNTLKRLTHSPATDTWPAAAPDGSILFASDRTGHWEIYRMDENGGHPAPVTRFGAFTTHPLPLPNGDLVVASDKDHPGNADPNSADGRYDLFLLDSQGTVKQKLTHEGSASSPCRLPDGGILYASNASGRLEIWLHEKGKNRRITDSRLKDRQRRVYAPVVLPGGRILVSVHETLRDPRLSSRELRYVASLSLEGKLVPLTDPHRSNASTKGY
ncbi:MAG: TolB family protein [Bacteroidota bacterium]